MASFLIAAIASLLRGRRYVHEEHGAGAGEQPGAESGFAGELQDAGPAVKAGETA